MENEVINGRIIVPHGIRKELIDEFNVSRALLEKILLGGHVRDRVKKDSVRKRAIELGGAEVKSW